MYCVYCRNNEAIYGAYCRNCGKLQQRGINSGAMFCAFCRADNPNDATFCWNCGNQFQREASRSTSDINIQPGIPLPGSLINGSQSLGGNVPMVQGIPQASNLPFVQGTPSPLSSPLSGPAPSHGVPFSSPPHVSPPHEYPHPPVHHPGHPPMHHPEPPAHLHHSGHPPVHHPTVPPVHHSGEPVTDYMHHHHPTHQHLEQVSTPQSSTIAKRAVRGGARVAGGLSRRALLALLVGGAATVAVGTAAAVVLILPSPDKPVSAYCNAIKNGDAPTAYNQLSSRLQAQMSEQQFASQVQQISSIKPISDCSTSNVQQNGSTATVTLKVTLFGISLFPLTFNVKVIEENGVWKLDDATLLSL